jgi:hypothetical protein
MIDEIREHEFDDLTDVRVLALLNDQYADVCGRFLWPFLETTTTLNSDANGILTTWPTDIKKIKYLYITTDTCIINVLDTVDNFFLKAGLPILNPWFKSTAFTLDYYKNPADITATTSPVFPVGHHRVLVLGALARAYYMTDDAQLGSAFEKQYEERILRMAADILRRNVGERKVVDVVYDYEP